MKIVDDGAQSFAVKMLNKWRPKVIQEAKAEADINAAPEVKVAG